MSFPQSIPPMDAQETYVQKGWRKCKEQPIVPLGVVLTCMAFLGATRSMRTGNKASFNRYLRFRVVAQGVTVLGCVAGAWWIGREARLEGMKLEREAAKRGERRMREGDFDDGLRERLKQAEKVWKAEDEADQRIPIVMPSTGAAAKTGAIPVSPTLTVEKTSAETNAAIARARETPAELKSKEVAQAPMKIGDLLTSEQLKERMERRAKKTLGKDEEEKEEKQV